jgi:hypothetical protein
MAARLRCRRSGSVRLPLHWPLLLHRRPLAVGVVTQQVRPDASVVLLWF